MVRPPSRHTLIKCDMRVNASQNHFRTQITNQRLGFNDELHSWGQHPDRRLMFHHQCLSLRWLFVHFSSSATLKVLTCFHLHLYYSGLIPTSRHTHIVSHFLPHWPMWAHTDNPSLPQIEFINARKLKYTYFNRKKKQLMWINKFKVQ